MAYDTPRFVFESQAVDRKTFHVVSFRGTEGLSTLYAFDITLIAAEADLDHDAILRHPARFVIKDSGGDVPFGGMVSRFEERSRSRGMVFYRARLVPRVWRTTLTHHNQIFLDKEPEAFLADALEDCGLRQGLHFEFKLQGNYPVREYVCQYNESHFNFLSRWMERDGMYYYFEQTDQGEKMIITDSRIAHSAIAGESLRSVRPSGMERVHGDAVVTRFTLKQRRLPAKVLLKDYNYRKPSLNMEAKASVSSRGAGEIYFYGEHFKTPEEGTALAGIRAEELVCRAKVFHGASPVPHLRSGYVFGLTEHYRRDFNQQYLVTRVSHEGAQEAYLAREFKLRLGENRDRLQYGNTFACIPASTQFRAKRKAVKPKFVGAMHARIDAAGSGKYAELDAQGRYTVILPMDLSGRDKGKASIRLRMAQPYGGTDHGLHFPLHKGAEVLLTCINGDPDRPIIQSAVPNPENPSAVTDASPAMNRLTTAGQNKMHFDDTEGAERILLHTPASNTWVRMGAAGDADPSVPEGAASLQTMLTATNDNGGTDDSGDDGGPEGAGKGYVLCSNDVFEVVGGWEHSAFVGCKGSVFGGICEEVVVGLTLDVFLGLSQKTFIGERLETSLAVKDRYSVAPTFAVNADLGVVFDLGDKKSFTFDKTEGKWTSTGIAEKMEGLKNNYTTLIGDLKKMQDKAEAIVIDKKALLDAEVTLTDYTTQVMGTCMLVADKCEQLARARTQAVNDVKSVCDEVDRLENRSTVLSGNVDSAATETNNLQTKLSVIAGLAEYS